MQIVPIWEALPQSISWRDKVCLLTFRSLQTLPQTESPVHHIFEPGVYIRELSLPAGVILTGREHLLGHRMELCKGSVLLFAPDGPFEFHAPANMDSKPGFHAVVYAMTDIVARTVHPNPEESRDIEALENKWFGSGEEVIERGRVLALEYDKELLQ